MILLWCILLCLLNFTTVTCNDSNYNTGPNYNCKEDYDVSIRCQFDLGNSCVNNNGSDNSTLYKCVCSHYGYEEKANNSLSTCQPISCTNINSVYPELIVRHCGLGVTECEGELVNRECTCNSSIHESSLDRRYCFHASCKTNPQSAVKCGFQNQCYGTYNQYICACNAFGYIRKDNSNSECVLAKCEDNSLDPFIACGKGALSCNGTLVTLQCECDTARGFVASASGSSCIPPTCSISPTYLADCGEGNGCVGGYGAGNFSCICSNPMYKRDPTDNRKCVKRTCDETPETPKMVCGEGALSCTGTVDAPICACNKSDNFVVTPDASGCVKATCSSNPAALAKCGEGNSCAGSYDEYICICGAFGYKYHATDGSCQETLCTENLEKACGIGASSCIGNTTTRKCICNEADYYFQSEDQRSCVKAPCRTNDTIKEICGIENTCLGSEDSFICQCNIGFLLDRTTNQACYLGTCENGDLDPVTLCGSGAMYCNGTMRNYTCGCDRNDGYVQSPDLTSCIPSDCRGNSTMHEKCGVLNSCVGSLDDWMCDCHAYGYRGNPSNMQTCDKVMCGDPGAENVTICGLGVTACDGHILNPVCKCDTTKNYIPSHDGTRCAPATCKNNKAALKACGIENSCSGSYDNYMCICNAFGYRLDGQNNQCVEITCDDSDLDIRAVCGDGGRACNGTAKRPVCFCNETEHFVPSEDSRSCVKESCKASNEVSMKCGPENSCIGSKESFICVCNFEMGYRLNTATNQECYLGTCENGELDHLKHCGKGSLSCKGNARNLTCECDKANGWVSSPNGMTCLPNDCRGNLTMHNECGKMNQCVGSIDDWRCICDGFGYETDPADIRKCRKKMCSDPDVDLLSLCGMGATGCTGPLINHRCLCNATEDFMTTLDGSKCYNPKVTSCKSNATAIEQCGVGNSCAGPANDFICICDSHGYYPDMNNYQRCLLRKCDDPDADYVEICGEGGIGCTGTMFNPVCKCNSAAWFYPIADRTSCVFASCRANQTVNTLCGLENECAGSMESHVCICRDQGYKEHPSNSQVCLEKTCEENDFDLITVCGKGALSCSGTLKNLTCNCDTGNGYSQTSLGNYCVPSDCQGNATTYDQCGPGNRCVGSLTDWRCLCDAPGYEPHPTDIAKCHQRSCGDATVDHVMVCGIGATGCTGPILSPKCECNTTEYFAPTVDGTACIKASCKTNKTALEQCGLGNGCSGSHDNFVCICDAYGYRLDDTNNQACVKSKCDDAGADYNKICGQGGIGCLGTVLNPVCECDFNKHFVPSPDRTSCLLSDCRGNATALEACGKANTCFGSASSYICVCDYLGYKTNPANMQECLLQHCENGELDPYNACGKGAVSCNGTIESLHCNCNYSMGYVASPDYSSCIPADCRANSTMYKQCGNGNGCVGSLTDWMCVCDSYGYTPHASDMKKCHQQMCSDSGIDPVAVCGMGATSCMGAVSNPTCKCNTTSYYVPSADGASCVPASCKTNKTALEQCGLENSCTGSATDFICICNAPNYRLDDNDNQKCVPKTCNDTNRDLVEICGYGATDCKGTAMNPVCECNTTEYFVPSPDRRTCVTASCRTNAAVSIACGKQNSCFGSASSWICDCVAYGYMLNPNNVQECTLGTCESGYLDPLYVCGKGAVSCKGIWNNYTCECDNDKGYVSSPDGSSCIQSSDCRANSTTYDQCGDANTCIGGMNDWVCVCDAPGYLPHPNDRQQCVQRMCSDSDIDFVEVCGIGATGCTGSINSPVCQCNTSKYFTPSADGFSCIPASCKSNKTALQQCGEENTCHGSADNFVCVCNAFGYRLDDSNNQACVEISCMDPGVNYKEICGMGSTGCKGTARSPICECNSTQYFIPSHDSKSCLLASCRANSNFTNSCGDGNSCIGSLTSHICVCDAAGFKLNPNNYRECIEETCEDDAINHINVCGKGAIGCKGTLNNITCHCDNDAGYYQSPDSKRCLSYACQQNGAAQDACGDGNKCVGSYHDWFCECSAAGYEPHPTNSSICIKKKCMNDPINYCGLGALSCTGNTLNPICTCDSSAGYMAAGNKHSCVPMDCTFNPNIDCGIGNTCKGSYFSYACVCSTPGTIRNMSNPMQCIDVTCPRDAVMACGEGATSCEVTSTNHVICECGKGYHPGPYKNTCVLDDCRYNDMATKACGLENMCVGSYKSWRCICQAPRYMQDPDNTQSCIHAPCRIEDCGSGYAPGSFQYYAESCNGTFFNPICNCQEEYEKDMLGGCVPKSCRENPIAVAECGENGYCKGTYFKYECGCQGPKYVQNPRNTRQCIEAPCNVQNCGHGFENELYVSFADSCIGKHADYTCQCKEGYTGTGTSRCIPDGKECGKSYCHANATCAPLGKGEFDCTCKPGYSGDGLYCFLDGGWSDFVNTRECNASCGTHGYAEVTRYCNNPVAERFGKQCGAKSPEQLEVPCNRFDCLGCTVKKDCRCTSVVKPLIVEGYNEPEETLKFFTDLHPDDVKKAKDTLLKWKAFSNENLCRKYNKTTLHAKFFGVRDAAKEVNKMKSSYGSARDSMRIKLDCNINIAKKTQYFGVYEMIVKRLFIMKQVVKDLHIIEDYVLKHMENCDDSPVGMIRNTFGK